MPSSPNINSDSTATFQAYSELATKVDDTAVADADLDEYVGAAYGNFIDTCLEQLNEMWNGERTITDAGIIARFGGAPATGFSTSADDIVFGAGSSSVGLSGYIPSSGTFRLAARTSTSSTHGLFEYLEGGAASEWKLYTSGNHRYTFGATAIEPEGTQSSGSDSNRWSAVYSSGTIYAAGAPTGTANALGDDIVVGTTGTTSIGHTFLCSNTFYEFIGDASSAVSGQRRYSHGSDQWQWYTAATQRMVLDASKLCPASAGGITLGTSGLPWGTIYSNDALIVYDTGGGSQVKLRGTNCNVRWSDGSDVTEFDIASIGSELLFRYGTTPTTSFSISESDGSVTFDKNVGFHGTAPASKPTITGSKGGNAALSSLITALSNYGLVTDSTT